MNTYNQNQLRGAEALQPKQPEPVTVSNLIDGISGLLVKHGEALEGLEKDISPALGGHNECQPCPRDPPTPAPPMPLICERLTGILLTINSQIELTQSMRRRLRL